MKKSEFQYNEKITVLCEAYSQAVEEALLDKGVGERIVITGEITAMDRVNGYVVEIKKLK